MKSYAVPALLALVMIFASCSKDEVDTPFYTADNGTSKALTEYEKAGLVTLLETQKMHRDVYIWMNANADYPVFSDLSDCDCQLMEKLSITVDKYGLHNPTVGKEPGEFEDSYVQSQYNDIIRSTQGSVASMFTAAKAMEAAMIAEVREQQDALSGNADIGLVYADLIVQSENQLIQLDEESRKGGMIPIPRDPVKDF